MIYLDNSATTKPYPEVLQVHQQVSERFLGIRLRCINLELMRAVY